MSREPRPARRLLLVLLLATALLMALYFLEPLLFAGPLGIALLLPGCLALFIGATRIFRPR